MRSVLRACCCIGLFVLASTVPLQAQSPGERIELGRFGATDPIPLDVVAEVELGGARELGQLELDGVDVAIWARSDERRIWIELPFELSDGEHIVVWTRDGVVLQEWRFRTGTALSALSEVEADAGGFVSLELSQRLVDRNLPPDTPHRTQLQGSADLFARASRGSFDRWPYGGAWSIDARLPVSYDRIGSEGPGRSAWGLADYQLDARLGPFGVRAGHFLPARPSLVLEGFFRRGTQASLDLAPLRTRITGFAVRTEPITGFREGFGVSDRSRRVHGLTLETQPLAGEMVSLILHGTYLRGRGRLGASTVGGDFAADQRSGTAWSGVAELGLFQERLRMRGEIARTRFDRDVGTLEGPRRDGAWSLLVGVTPWLDATLFGEVFTTTLEYEQREVGPRFESLANPLAPIDRSLRQLRWETRWAGFDARVSFVREKDNIDDLPTLPRFRTDLFDADLRWSAAPLVEGAPVWRRLLGTPFLGFGWSRERLQPIRGVDPRGLVPIALFPFAEVVAPLLPGLGVIPVVIGSPFGTPFDPSIAPFGADILDDRKLRVTRFQAGTRYDGWGVSASHIIRRDQDLTRRAPLRRTDLTSFDADWSIGEDTRLTLGLQQQRERSRLAGFQTITIQGRLGLDAALRPELRAGGDLSLSRTRDSGATDLTIWSATGFVEWIAARPDGLSPGVQLTLSGTYQDFQDDALLGLNGNQYQLFLTATVWWERGR